MVQWYSMRLVRIARYCLTFSCKHGRHILHDTTKNEVPPCRLKSRQPYNREAQAVLCVIREDRSKDAWIAAAWKQELEASEPSAYVATYRTQEKASMEKI